MIKIMQCLPSQCDLSEFSTVPNSMYIIGFLFWIEIPLSGLKYYGEYLIFSHFWLLIGSGLDRSLQIVNSVIPFAVEQFVNC